MGLGTSKLQEELSRKEQQLSQTQEQLVRAQARGSQLEDEADELKERLQARDEKLSLRERQLADANKDATVRLDAKELECRKAKKAQQVAEELRRSDALLVKRVTTALLRTSHGGEQGLLGADASDAETSTLAAQVAVAANDELALRKASLAPHRAPPCRYLSLSRAHVNPCRSCTARRRSSAPPRAGRASCSRRSRRTFGASCARPCGCRTSATPRSCCASRT